MKMSHYGTYWVSFFKGVILVLLILALTGCSHRWRKEDQDIRYGGTESKIEPTRPNAIDS